MTIILQDDTGSCNSNEAGRISSARRCAIICIMAVVSNYVRKHKRRNIPDVDFGSLNQNFFSRGISKITARPVNKIY